MLIKSEEYKKYLVESEHSANTIQSYLNTLGQLENYCVDHEIEDLSKDILLEFKSYLRSEHYKISTCNLKITELNIYFNWLGREDLKLKNFKTQQFSFRDCITDSEYKKLLSATEGELKLFMLTAANTGLRVSELCGLKKSDLYLEMIPIENKGKTRIIAIPEFVNEQLKKFMKNEEDDCIIFRQSQTTYRDHLKKLSVKADVDPKRVYPHTFRHLFAKNFVRSGGDSTQLQQLLGHSQLATTAIYTHMSNRELAEVFRTIENR